MEDIDIRPIVSKLKALDRAKAWLARQIGSTRAWVQQILSTKRASVKAIKKIETVLKIKIPKS